MNAGVLAGLRVVELSAFVAAPLAGATLAGLGAEVIRVEQLGGGIDAHRWPVHDGRSLYRAGLDRGKRSLAVDLKSPRGQSLVVELLRGGGLEGGILVTNLSAQGWLAYERLKEARGDLIMVVIKGTASGAPAVDYTVNAALGFPFLTGSPESSEPTNHVLPAWDIATGMLAATAVLAAERRRRLTGSGGLVELALADVALETARTLGYLAEAELIPEPRARFGNQIYGTYGRDFQTADGRYVMVCALTPRQWESLVAVTGCGEKVNQLETELGVNLRDEGHRFENRDAINELIGGWIGSRTLTEVAALFDDSGVLWAPYRTFKEVISDPAARTEPASPVHFIGESDRSAVPAPVIGADSERLLRDHLKLADGDIAELRATGVLEG